MSRAADLYRLQQLDDKWDAGAKRLAEIEAALADDAALRQAQKSAQAADELAQRQAVRQKDLELELQGIKDEITVAEQRLYSGVIRNPKELGDLQAKIASLKRFLERKEDELLQAMLDLEEAEEAQRSAHESLRDKEAAWAAAHESLLRERDEVQAAQAQVEQAREALLVNIPPSDLDIYRDLRQDKGGWAVAVLRDGSCTACGIQVPAWRLGQGRESGLLTCGNCERILVTDREARKYQA